MVGVIYYIRSTATGRVYVGSTTRGSKQRWLEHLHYLRKGSHHSKHLQRVYSKYGEQDLQIEVAYECQEHEDLLVVEQEHIDRFVGLCMNGIPVSRSIYAAHAANRGRVMTDAEKERRSKSAKASIAEGRAKRGPWSDERKLAHSERLTGRKMPVVSEQAKANISAGLRLGYALRGESAKPSLPDQRTAFIGQEIDSWMLLRKQGKSYREIERLTGRARKVVARECKRAADGH